MAGASFEPPGVSPTWLAVGSRLSTLSYPMLGHPSSVGESRIHPGEAPAGGQPSLEHQGTQGDSSAAAQWASITPALGVPCSPLPWGVLPVLALTLCPAPFPQGFPPSQPGGRESRSTDNPLSPRPAQSKVGTGLGARHSRAQQGHTGAAGSFIPLACFRAPGRAPRAVGSPAIPFPPSTASPGPRPGVGFPSLTNSFLLVRVGSPPWRALSGMVALHPL